MSGSSWALVLSAGSGSAPAPLPGPRPRAQRARRKNTASAIRTVGSRQTGVAMPRARRATSSPGQSESFPVAKFESFPTRTPMIACPSRSAAQATTTGTGQSPYQT